MRVLIVEDEVRLAQNIAQLLQETVGYVVDVCTEGVDGLHMAITNPYDLIVLDLTLPELDGMEVLARLRETGNKTAVLILTARDTQADIVQGLNAGGDDYLTKPFDIAELVARCKALVRRAYDRPDPYMYIGKLTIDTNSRKVSMDGQSIHLTAMEYRTLEYLALREGEIVSKEDLLEHLYDFNWERFSNVLEVYVSSLRRKLDPERIHQILHTVRGQGYSLGIDPS